jgi:hypothetical protein
MILLKPENEIISFYHVPKTAGRYVSECLMNSQIKDKLLLVDGLYSGKEVMHLNALYSYSYLVDKRVGLPSSGFFIVRNPIEKFTSALRFFDLSKKEISSLENFDYFYNFMTTNQLIQSFYGTQSLIYGAYNADNNWFISQFEYKNEINKFWKYENQFNDRFWDWVSYNFKINIAKSVWSKVERFDSGECKAKQEKYKLTNKIEENIYKFYKKDFEMFGY